MLKGSAKGTWQEIGRTSQFSLVIVLNAMRRGAWVLFCRKQEDKIMSLGGLIRQQYTGRIGKKETVARLLQRSKQEIIRP